MKFFQDNFEHAVSIRQQIIIPESQDAITAFLQIGRASRISIALFGVLTAIELNDQHGFGTQEIYDEWIDCDLTSKLEAIEASIAQTRPETRFGFGLIDT